MEAIYVHPEKRHKRNKVSDMQGGRRRIDPDIGTDSFIDHEVFELIPVSSQQSASSKHAEALS